MNIATKYIMNIEDQIKHELYLEKLKKKKIDAVIQW